MFRNNAFHFYQIHSLEVQYFCNKYSFILKVCSKSIFLSISIKAFIIKHSQMYFTQNTQQFYNSLLLFWLQTHKNTLKHLPYVGSASKIKGTSHTQNDIVHNTSSALAHCKSIRVFWPQTQWNRPSSVSITLPGLTFSCHASVCFWFTDRAAMLKY